MQYHRHEDALIAKLRLLEITQSDLGQRFLRGFQESMNAQHAPEERLPTGMIAEIQKQTLTLADPIYVSDDITDVVDKARETFVPETLLPGDPWCSNGFALFPRPILLDDAPVTERNQWRSPGSFIPVRAMAWMAAHSEDLSQGCYWISHYTDIDDDIAQGRPAAVESEEHTSFFRRHMPLSLVHQWQWTWGMNPIDARAQRVEGESEEQSEARAREQAAFIQSFWRIGQQFVATKQRVPRGIWRDAMRKGIKDRDVTVITLRRSQDYEYEETDRHLTVRFVVRGHWRNQPFGPRDNRFYRQIWIAPFVKGPEDAPLVLTERAWEFVR